MGAAKTSSNFFNKARDGSNAGGGNSSLGISGNLNQPSQNSLFGGDSTSQPMGSKAKQGNFTNVVADDADDDWDEEPST